MFSFRRAPVARHLPPPDAGSFAAPTPCMTSHKACSQREASRNRDNNDKFQSSLGRTPSGSHFDGFS